MGQFLFVRVLSCFGYGYFKEKLAFLHFQCTGVCSTIVKTTGTNQMRLQCFDVFVVFLGGQKKTNKNTPSSFHRPGRTDGYVYF